MDPIYSTNPLVNPIINFHSKISSSFDNLPSQGKILEIAKRVALIAISPLAYLALGLLALAGLAFNSVSQNRDIKNIPNTPAPTQNQKHLFSIASECDKTKKQFMSIVNEAKKINQLQAAKIFIDIECDDKKFSKDHIVKPLDPSHFDHFYLSGVIDTILLEAKAFLKTQNTDKLSFKWVALLKDKSGAFHGAHGSRTCFSEEEEYRSKDVDGIDTDIDFNHLEEYFNQTLQQMQREVKPQLDDQLNFI
ncbi:MAG TPA: hypothetical protein VHL30_04670 [Chlamydiales bacterium]|jgi:hypothetical protein|nr:hypothetical protein [Chlamydiales bacterium]